MYAYQKPNAERFLRLSSKGFHTFFLHFVIMTAPLTAHEALKPTAKRYLLHSEKGYTIFIYQTTITDETVIIDFTLNSKKNFTNVLL